MFAHVCYGSLFIFVRKVYMKVHDYRRETIYADDRFVRAKRIATTFDASFHLLAVVLLMPIVAPVPALWSASVGGFGFFLLFAPNALVQPLRRLRATVRPTPAMQNRQA